MNSIKAFFAARGGIVHFCALGIVFLVGAFATVPAFHVLCMDIWAHTPSWSHETAAALAGLYALYTTSHAIQQTQRVKLLTKRLEAPYIPAASGAAPYIPQQVAASGSFFTAGLKTGRVVAPTKPIDPDPKRVIKSKES